MEIAQVRTRLREIYHANLSDAPYEVEDGEPSWGGVVVWESISRTAFHDYLDQHEGDLRRWVYEPLTADTGRVVVYSLGTRTHAFTTSEIVTGILSQLEDLGGINVQQTRLHVAGDLTVDVGVLDQVADAAFVPVGLSWPTVVVEVAYKNDSLAALETKLSRWMGPTTTVQVAIGVKIFLRSQRRLAVLHLRGGGTHRVEFGPNATLQPPPPLRFPLQVLYTGADIPASLSGHANHNVSVDLVTLLTVIEETIATEKTDRR